MEQGWTATVVAMSNLGTAQSAWRVRDLEPVSAKLGAQVVRYRCPAVCATWCALLSLVREWSKHLGRGWEDDK